MTTQTRFLGKTPDFFLTRTGVIDNARQPEYSLEDFPDYASSFETEAEARTALADSVFHDVTVVAQVFVDGLPVMRKELPADAEVPADVSQGVPEGAFWNTPISDI